MGHLKKRSISNIHRDFSFQGKKTAFINYGKRLMDFDKPHGSGKITCTFFLEMGCKMSDANQTLYLYQNHANLVFLVVYADDILLLSYCDEAMQSIVCHFKRRFEVRVTKNIEQFLGFTVEDNENRKNLHNSAIVKRILQYFHVKEGKSAPTPLAPNLDLSSDEREMLQELTPYRRLIGSLMHLANTVHPGISYATGYISRFMHRHTADLWTVEKRIIRYLKETEQLGIVYRSDKNSCVLTAFANADWGQERANSKSIAGNAIGCCGALLHWKSKQQTMLALRSNEPEYVAHASCIQEDMWFEKLAPLLKVVLDRNMVDNLFHISIGEENQACIFDATSPTFSEHTKHISLRYCYLGDHIRKNDVNIQCVQTNDMIADILTKNLGTQKYQ